MDNAQTGAPIVPSGTPLPVASPVEVSAGWSRMAPTKAVSEEIASLLPPVGILRESQIVREAPVAPPPIAKPTTAPLAADHGNEGRLVSGSSIMMTIALVATAAGVCAMAMIPVLNQKHDDEKATATVPADALKDTAPTATGSDQSRSQPQISDPSASGTSPAARPRGKVVSDPADDAALDEDLAQITSLLRRKDIEVATAEINRIAARQGSELQVAKITQFAALVSAVQNFWEVFETALDQVSAGRSVRWGGQEAALVEVSESHLIVRRAGQSFRVLRSELSEQEVRALAESLLDLDDPRNQVSLGAFHFIMQGADSSEARRLWHIAAREGEDTSLLMPLLAEP